MPMSPLHTRRRLGKELYREYREGHTKNKNTLHLARYAPLADDSAPRATGFGQNHLAQIVRVSTITSERTRMSTMPMTVTIVMTMIAMVIVVAVGVISAECWVVTVLQV